MIVSERYVIGTLIAIGAVLLTGVAVTVALAYRYGRQVEVTDLTPAQLADCGDLMQVRFPEVTEAVGFLASVKGQSHIRLRVRIAAAAWDDFISSSKIRADALALEPRRIGGFEGAPAWWTPEELPNALSGQTPLLSKDGAGVLRLLRSATGSDPVEVYLEWEGAARGRTR